MPSRCPEAVESFSIGSVRDLPSGEGDDLAGPHFSQAITFISRQFI
jgi:hypothetical protein